MSTSRAPRRVVLYGRVSQDRAEGKSVDDQLAELRAWANREGWQVVTECRDDGISASRYANGKARPGWQRVVDLITASAVDIVAVWEISRASRDRSVFAALLATCQETGVLIATGGRLHDPEDADDGFLLDLGGALAVREAGMTAKRVRRAAASRAAAGRPHGALPYGYRRICDVSTGRTLCWEPHPEQAPVVTEIVTRLLAREPAAAIATDLNARGVPSATGRRWGSVTVSALAQRPTYAGLRVHGGEVLDGVSGTWPALVSTSAHYELVALYVDPQRDKYRNSSVVKHLGTGIYRCGRTGCDGRMRVVVEAGKANRYACRSCYRSSQPQACVDELVTAVITARLACPDVVELLTQPQDEAACSAAAEVARLQAKLAQARELWDADRLSAETLADLEARILPKIRAAQQRIRRREIPSVVLEAAGPTAESAFAACSISDRRVILDTLMVVTLLPTTQRQRGPQGRPFDPDEVRIEWRHH